MSATTSAASSAPSTPKGHFTSLSGQVGGHPGVLASDDGAVVVKPALSAEATFYTRLNERDPALVPLQPFVPSFYGTLLLAGSAPPEGIEAGLQPPPLDIPDADKSVLDLFVHQFYNNKVYKPNILDIKLGTVLYADDAPPEKRERMLKAARETTSLQTGIRITGFQVYDNKSLAPTVIPKTYGRSLKADELSEAIRRFFPLNTSKAGRAYVPCLQSPSGELSALGSDSSTQVSGLALEGPGLPPALLIPVLRGIVARTRALRAAFAQTELRIVGSSLLIIYEADWERAAQRIGASIAPGNEGKAETEAVAMDAEGAIITEDDGYAEDDETGTDDGEEVDEEDSGLPYAVSLIDFAHAKEVPGEGPDERVLFGIDTVIRLFDGRLAEVESESRDICI